MNEETCVQCEKEFYPEISKARYTCDECVPKHSRCPSCKGTGFTGFARTFDETCSCCLGTGEINEET